MERNPQRLPLLAPGGGLLGGPGLRAGPPLHHHAMTDTCPAASRHTLFLCHHHITNTCTLFLPPSPANLPPRHHHSIPGHLPCCPSPQQTHQASHPFTNTPSPTSYPFPLTPRPTAPPAKPSNFAVVTTFSLPRRWEHCFAIHETFLHSFS